MSRLTKITQTFGSISPGTSKLLFFGFVQLAILYVWLNWSFFTRILYWDVELYFNYASSMLEGNLPYRDFAVEYPPLSLLLLLLPRLFSANVDGYTNGFIVMAFTFHLIGLFLTSRLSLGLGLGHAKTLAVYSMAFFALGDIVVNRFDIFSAIMMLGAIYCYVNNRNKLGWFILGLGTLIKIYPLILAPFFAIPYLLKRQYRPLTEGLAVFGLTGLALVLPSLIISPSGFWEFIDFHGTRGLQLESGYSSILMMADALGFTSVSVVGTPTSIDLQGSCSQFLVSASPFIIAVALLVCYWLYYRSVKAKGYNHDLLISFSLGAIALLLVTSKVFSTQFVIWLYPLVALVNNRMRHPAWLIFICIALMSFYIFPYDYMALVELKQPAVSILLVRNLLVLTLGILVMVASTRQLNSMPDAINHQ